MARGPCFPRSIYFLPRPAAVPERRLQSLAMGLDAYQESVAIDAIVTRGSCSTTQDPLAASTEDAIENLTQYGAAILEDCVSQKSVDLCREHILGMTSEIMEGALLPDGGVDSSLVDKKQWGIRRLAKIGTGKTNIHFDMYGGSVCHDAMAKLGEASGLTALIREYCGDDCTLSETGVSLTGPNGGGLEWHIDGAEGECTMIMSLDDVQPEQGMLGLVLGSHTMLDRDADEDFDVQIEGVVKREKRSAYAYRAGKPIVFDARLIHSAEESKSERTRVILWWIYNGGH